MFNGFFASSFNTDDGLRSSQCPEPAHENDQLPTDPQLVQDLLLQLNPYKPVRPDGIHPRIFKELADVIARPPSMSFEQFGNLERSQLAGSWLMLSQVSWKVKRMTLEILAGQSPFSDWILQDKMSSIQLDKHIMQQALKRDLDKSEIWASINHLKFNKVECQILHLGWGSPGYVDRLGNETLKSSTVERNLGVLVDGKLNLKTLSSRSVSCCLEEETNPQLTTTTLQGVVECDKVTSQSPPG
ncbi:hypothetical protein DUI87_18616 [Hirundo rustica rustica]|uniref:Uncharacterized protein n=1 Tax=Hirundo rustica rustica TaxID=333673 RepID=A0A3M0K2H1_HIRRU|nr:hypothetical protein DUI87_18616 [Hirundo rustica rustica]